MKTEAQITARLNELQRQHRTVSSDLIDPELEAQIRELNWVLEDKAYIYNDSTT